MTSHGKIRFLILAAVLGLVLMSGAVARQQTAGELFEKALYVEEGQGDLQKAIGLYQDIVKKFPGEREIAAKAQLHIGLCYEKLGLEEAEKAFQKVVSDFPDQKGAVDLARKRLSLLLRARAALASAPQGLSARLLWSGPEAETVSHVSPDGRFLSFIEKESGDLCIRDIASGKQRVVVGKDRSEKPFEFPLTSCWSPDGRKLAYGWFNADNSVELRVVDTDGSNLQSLFRQKGEMAFPVAWSPDGRNIAVNLIKDLYKSYQVALISAKDGSVSILKTAKLLETAPGNMAFSSDGLYVLIDLPQSDRDPKHDIFALSVDGRREFKVVEHPAKDSVIGWVPGFNALLFSSDRTGSLDAWMVDVSDGRAQGEPRLVRRSLGQVTPLGISRGGSLFYRMGTTTWDIRTVSFDLETQTVIEPPALISQALMGANHQPQWSPDGRFLAFVSERKAEGAGANRITLWIRSTETGETRQIKTDLESLYRPRWAPDSRSIFVLSPSLRRIDVQTGRSTLLAENEPGAYMKFVAPAADGKSVYYTSFDFAQKRSRIVRLDLTTREAREIYRQEAPPDIGGLSVSPDGKQLLFGTLAPDGRFVLKVIPLPEGQPREIIKAEAVAFGDSIGIHGAFSWAPDGKKILFFKDIPGEKQNIKSELSAVPVDGGPIQGLGLVVDGSPDVISLHPDGRRLAFSASRPGAEIWVLENFLPAAPAGY
ncbi:MAG: tetratricopeptide repeat protein, partial [Candidatus Aminicenantes bacterium]